MSPHEQARMHWGLRGSAPPGRGSPPGSLHPCWHAECLKCFCSWLMCSSLAETSALPTLCSELRRVCCSRILIHYSILCPQTLPITWMSHRPGLLGKPHSFASLPHSVRVVDLRLLQLCPAEAEPLGGASDGLGLLEPCLASLKVEWGRAEAEMASTPPPLPFLPFSQADKCGLG